MFASCLHVNEDVVLDTVVCEFVSTFIFPWSILFDVQWGIQWGEHVDLLTSQEAQNYKAHNILFNLFLGAWTLVYQKT